MFAQLPTFTAAPFAVVTLAAPAEPANVIAFPAPAPAPVAPAPAPVAPAPAPVAPEPEPAEKAPKSLTAAQIAKVNEIVENSDRNNVIKVIKDALKARTGVTWSVTGGRGTAYGWIRIDAPKARRCRTTRLKEGATNTNPESYEWYEDPSITDRSMTLADNAKLAKALGLEGSIHCQGESIPSDWTHYKEYVARALYGTPGHFKGVQYWD